MLEKKTIRHEILAARRALTPAERREVEAILPVRAQPLFDAMPRNDQRHSLNVLRALAAGEVEQGARDGERARRGGTPDGGPPDGGTP
mgnify:CR=1 FL=1